MSEWISVESKLPEYEEETVVHILLKDDESGWIPARYDQLLKKAWWIPQREAFVFKDVEDAIHLITHWQPLPEPPK